MSDICWRTEFGFAKLIESISLLKLGKPTEPTKYADLCFICGYTRNTHSGVREITVGILSKRSRVSPLHYQFPQMVVRCNTVG